jgi:histidinol phosphatase-like enzyme
VITNQSSIARGYFGEPALARMHAHLAGALAFCAVGSIVVSMNAR